MYYYFKLKFHITKLFVIIYNIRTFNTSLLKHNFIDIVNIVPYSYNTIGKHSSYVHHYITSVDATFNIINYKLYG